MQDTLSAAKPGLDFLQTRLSPPFTGWIFCRHAGGSQSWAGFSADTLAAAKPGLDSLRERRSAGP
jgi:hypothetical protein